LREADMARLVACRGAGYADPHELRHRVGLGRAALARLAEADAFGSMALDRRAGLWAVQGLGEAPLPLFAAAERRTAAPEPPVTLPPSWLGEEVTADYTTLRLSLKAHPLALLRTRLAREGIAAHAELGTIGDGKRVTVAGLVLVRQRPGSARGVIFATLEDETGPANIIIWPDIFERFHRVVLAARLLALTGKLQREGIVVHVIAERLVDLTHLLAGLGAPSEQRFDAMLEAPLFRSDEIKRPHYDKRTYPSRDFH
jgi:error-prone DNA polymerase